MIPYGTDYEDAPWIDRDGQPIDNDPSGSAGSSSPSGYMGEGMGWTGRCPLNAARDWLARFICTCRRRLKTDPVSTNRIFDLLALWAAHTHLVFETYTTPGLLADSPVPGSGKTTLLEHLERLCVHPIQMASVSSPAMLARVLADGIRTIEIDEADRSLDPDKPEIKDLLAVLNSGYKRGGTRPVLTPVKGGGWQVTEMSTFAPVVMAGNNPNLPDYTKSRCIRVLLLPDLEGTAEESD